MNAALEHKLTTILRHILLIEDDVALAADAELVQQIGLDSIEAFDAVATLHEIIGHIRPAAQTARECSEVRHNVGQFAFKVGLIRGRALRLGHQFLSSSLDRRSLKLSGRGSLTTLS